MSQLSLEQANIIIESGLNHAQQLGMKPLCIVVVDAGGHLVAVQRQDGSSMMRPRIAMAKASGALALGFSSRKIAEIAGRDPNFIAGLGPIAPHGLVAAAGGVIVVDSEDRILGAVGVTGDTADNDENCAIAGIDAAGLFVRT